MIAAQDLIPQKELNLNPDLLPPNKMKVHHAKAGLNPLVDHANYLFSILGKLRAAPTYEQLQKLHSELLQEIRAYYETIQRQGYIETATVCRYILCAAFDDVILHSSWGCHVWGAYSLLDTFNQDKPQEDRFFAILERVIKEPQVYIDLMELLYLCLSLGYKGKYRNTEHSQYQLESITNNLYLAIRAYRGDTSKTLSPPTLKKRKFSPTHSKKSVSFFFISIVTVMIIMAIFICLGYLMDVITNEAFKQIDTVQQTSTL